MKKEQQFFDQLAKRWDDLRSPDPVKIELLVKLAGLREGDRVLDIGCGTGVLIPYVKKALGAAGLITALDFSANMTALAAAKHKDLAGVEFITGDIMDFETQAYYDKIICFNFFPHATDKRAFLIKIRNMLALRGAVVIMHDMSRTAVNSIHKNSAVVKDDRLPAGTKTAELLETCNYLVADVIDNDDLYFVKAVVR